MAEQQQADLSTGSAVRYWLAALASRESLITWGILVAPVVVIGVAFFPGQLNPDMSAQIVQVATGEFTNQWAPLLEALWSPLWDLGFRQDWVLLAQLFAFVGGAYLVLRAAFAPIPAALVTGAIALSPPVFSHLGSIQRDVWFTALLILTFGLVVRAGQVSWPVRGRVLMLAVASAWLALAARQNAAAAVVCACAVIVGLALERRREIMSAVKPQGRRAHPLLIAVAGGIVLTLALMGTQLAASHVIGARNVNPEATLFVYDLGAISKRERENLFPPEVVAQRGVGVIDQAYDADTARGFVLAPAGPIDNPYWSQTAEPLRAAWWDAVREHPRAYVDARWDLWLRQIAVTRGARAAYQEVVAADNHGTPLRFPALHDAAMSYQRAFGHLEKPPPPDSDTIVGGPAFSVWAYLLVALAGVASLLRRGRSWPLLTVGALAVAALTYQVGLFLGAMVVRYWFELPSVVAGMLTGAVLLHLAWSRWRSASGSTQPSPGATR